MLFFEEDSTQETLQDIMYSRMNMEQTYKNLDKYNIPVIVHYGEPIEEVFKNYPILHKCLNTEGYLSSKKINAYIGYDMIKEECGLTNFLINVILNEFHKKELI